MRRTRKGGQRRTRHPMPDLTKQSIEDALKEERGEAVRRGPQAELCRATMCCVCWALYLKRRWARGIHGQMEPPPPIDWSLLPPGPPWANVAHHEPEGVGGDDDDTIPLCVPHHTGPSFKARHPGNARDFWEHYQIEWTKVRDEMRRRVRNSQG